MATIVQKGAACYGQEFGHDFRIANSVCSRCGVGQEDLSGQLQKIEYFVKKPERGLHSEVHALAKEISEFCGEPKKFGMYLGVIKNIGLPKAYKIFAEIKQGKNIETPGKLFLYLSAYEKRKNKNGNYKTEKRKFKNGNRKRAGKNSKEKVKRGGKSIA